jgi:hypothetical protein
MFMKWRRLNSFNATELNMKSAPASSSDPTPNWPKGLAVLRAKNGCASEACATRRVKMPREVYIHSDYMSLSQLDAASPH